jgi:predicted chitinase
MTRSRQSAAPETSARPVRRPDNLTGAGSTLSNADQQHALSTQPVADEKQGWFARMFGGKDKDAKDQGLESGVEEEVPAVAAAPDRAARLLAAITAQVVQAVPELASREDRAEALAMATQNVPPILKHCLEQGVKVDTQVAYILATAWHESGFGMTKFGRSESLVEDHNPFNSRGNGANRRMSATNHVSGRRVQGRTHGEMEKKYWDDAYGGRLDNRKGTSDAANYRGRGFVQLTGKTNYAKMTNELNAEGYSYTHEGTTYGGQGNPPIDLVTHFTHVNEVPDLAARILVEGTMEGKFTGRPLPDYINEEKTELKDARAVINGDKATNGGKVGREAEHFMAALRGDAAWASLFEVAQS